MTPANRSRRGSLPIGMRVWLGVGFLLAVGATAIAALSVDAAWLRLAVLLVLWAALIAAFALTWSRRDVRTSELRVEESKLTYQLELQREISARREFEVTVADTAKAEAEDRHAAELAGLREQLDRLNSTLAGLFDGDLLFERLTLSAESTRVRQVSDGGRTRFAAVPRPGQLDVAPDGTEPARPTVDGQPSVVLTAPIPDDHVVTGSGNGRPDREDDTVQFPRITVDGGQAGPAPEIVDAVPAVDLQKQVGNPAVDELPVAVDTPVITDGEVDEPTPAVDDSGSDSVPPSEPESVPAEADEPAEAHELAEAGEPAEVEERAEAEEQPGADEPAAAEELAGAEEPAEAGELAGAEEPAEAGEPAEAEEPVADVEVSDIQAAAEPGAVSDHDVPAPADEQPAVEHREPAETVPVEQPEVEPEAGHIEPGHSEGISVAELLAAYGAADGAPRRRRRAQD